MKFDSSFLAKMDRNLNLDDYSQVSRPIELFRADYHVPHDRQYILRMLVRRPKSDLRIPPELDWLRTTIRLLCAYQAYNLLYNQFVYVTVRHGLVTSETDDDWHVDGFSLRKPSLPDQNYIWSDTNSTEYVDQAFPIPSSFDPLKHNLHTYLSEQVKQENIKQMEEKTIYLIDPYVVHRRPKNTAGTMRTFWRISFIEIEVEDNRNTPNPLLPCKQYSRADIRDTLVRFEE